MRSCDSTIIFKSIKNSDHRYRTQKCYRCHALESAGAPESNFQRSTSFWFNVSKQLDAFYRFTRPHTIIGTIVGVTSVSLLPIQSMADIPPVFLGLLKVLIPAVLMNVYVVGLNQLYDIEIDKINKPNLPLASGEFSIETGIILVAVAFFMSFAIGLMAQSPPLLYALLTSFLLGSAYSVNLPFLRWKQNPLLAATCIVSVRAIVVQIAFFVHMQKYTLGRPIVFTRSLISATAFMCFFSVVIALFKDIPDIEGDRKFGIQSFSVHIGQKRVFWLCVSLLSVAYASAMLIGVASSSTLCRLVNVFGHALLALVLWHKALSIDFKNRTCMTSFYMFIWKLFYAEYFLIPFIR